MAVVGETVGLGQGLEGGDRAPALGVAEREEEGRAEGEGGLGYCSEARDRHLQLRRANHHATGEPPEEKNPNPRTVDKEP